MREPYENKHALLLAGEAKRVRNNIGAVNKIPMQVRGESLQITEECKGHRRPKHLNTLTPTKLTTQTKKNSAQPMSANAIL